ncbi:hypothetical protein [Pedobacter steynii]
MLRVKEVRKLFTDYFESHKQVNAVYTLDVKGFIGKRDKEYLCANVNYIDSSISGNIHNYNFQITISDLLIPTKENEIDIYDSTLLVAEDFLTFLQFNPAWTFPKNAVITNFTDSDGDRIAGVTFRVTVQVIRAQNPCSAPIQ